MDAFSQWEEKNISTNTTLSSVNFLNDEIGFVTSSNMIFQTEDGGDNWSLSHSGFDLVLYEDVFAIDNDEIIAVGKDLNLNQAVITKTVNGGQDWIDVAITNSSFLKSVFFTSADIGYCSGGSGTILKTTDSGESWQELITGTFDELQSIYFVNDLVGIAVGGSPLNSRIIKTTDGGVNWNPITSPSSNYLQSVFFSNQDTGFVVGWNGEIMKTENCGNTWTVQSSVAMSGNLKVQFTDENTGFIVGGSTDESLIQKTNNGGDLWEDISPQTSEGLRSIHFPSLNVGYAVGSNGTVLKTDSNGTMTSINNLETKADFKLFPNPVDNFVSIQSENNKAIQLIKIYNSNGVLVNEFHSNSAKTELDLSNLTSNVYYLEIHSEESKTIKKIVVR